jgi:hypothetical protein
MGLQKADRAVFEDPIRRGLPHLTPAIIKPCQILRTPNSSRSPMDSAKQPSMSTPSLDSCDQLSRVFILGIEMHTIYGNYQPGELIREHMRTVQHQSPETLNYQEFKQQTDLWAFASLPPSH